MPATTAPTASGAIRRSRSGHDSERAMTIQPTTKPTAGYRHGMR